MLLQTTRKEHNWKTEEALVQAAAKGPILDGYDDDDYYN